MIKIDRSCEDWNTNTNDSMINGFRDLMLENEKYDGEPSVGIFWYDVNKNELFGVYKTLALDTQFNYSTYFNKNIRTCRKLHYQIWKKEQQRKKDSRFLGDYTIIPRGRIFEIENEGFIVCVGDWITKHPEAKQEIIYEFDLPEDKTEFLVDSHWDIGHGWSDKIV